MKILLTILIQLIMISLVFGQGRNSDKILLIELDEKLETSFYEKGITNLYTSSLTELLQEYQGYRGFDIKAVFNKTASDAIFNNSKNIIRITSVWLRRFDSSYVCCMGGDCRSWQLCVQLELKKKGIIKSKHVLDGQLDKNQMEKILSVFENVDREPIIDNKVHNCICIESSPSFASNPLIIEYFDELRSKYGASKIYFDNQKYTCTQRCFLTDCTKLVLTGNHTSDYIADYMNYSLNDISASRIIRSDTIRNEKKD